MNNNSNADEVVVESILEAKARSSAGVLLPVREEIVLPLERLTLDESILIDEDTPFDKEGGVDSIRPNDVFVMIEGKKVFVCPYTKNRFSICNCRSCRQRNGCPYCSGGVGNGICWHDANSKANESPYYTGGMFRAFNNATYEERVGIVSTLNCLDCDPVAWKFFMKGVYEDLPDIPTLPGSMGREYGKSGWCAMRFDDRPAWDDKSSFCDLRQQVFFKLFRWALESVPDIIGVDVKSYLETDSESIVLALTSGSSDVPLVWRWAALRAYTTLLGPSHGCYWYLRNKVDALQVLCSEFYPILVKPESISDALVWVRDVFVNLLVTLKDTSTSVGAAILESLTMLCSKAMEKPLEVLKNFHDWFTESVADSVSRSAKKHLAPVLDFLRNPITHLLFKTMIRWWVGYTVAAMVMEVSWDKDLFMLLGFLIDIVSGFSTKISRNSKLKESEKEAESFVPEASEGGQNAALVIALLIASFTTFSKVAFSVDPTFINELMTNMYRSASTCEKLKLGDSIEKLTRYMTGVAVGEEERIRFEARYPKTMEFVTNFNAFLEKQNPTMHDKFMLRHYYVEVMKERTRWDKDDVSRLTFLTQQGFRYVSSLGSTSNFQFRRQPAFFVFCGPPGIGKSILVETATNSIAVKNDKTAKDQMSSHVYTFAPTDQFQSGYSQQCIWRFDELFQKVDTVAHPASDVSIIFNMCGVQPFHLNMAAVEDKGIIARCYLAVGATNVKLGDKASESLTPHIKSCKEPSAVRRRLTHVVKPILREGFVYDKAAKCIRNAVSGQKLDMTTYVPIKDLFVFRVIGIDDKPMKNRFGREFFEWADVLRMMWKEFTACRDYIPNDLQLEEIRDEIELCEINESDISGGEDEVYEAEGFSDWFPVVGAVLASTAVAGTAAAIVRSKTATFDWSPTFKKCSCDNDDVCEATEMLNIQAFGSGELPQRVSSCVDIDGSIHSSDKGNAVYSSKRGRNLFLRFVKHEVSEANLSIASTEDFQSLFVLGKVTTCLFETDIGLFKRTTVATVECFSGDIDYPHVTESELKWAYYGSLVKYLMIPAVLAIVGGAISHRLLKKMVVDEEDDGVVIVDGIPHFYDQDTQSYQAEARPSDRARVYRNGKWFWKILTKDGYKYYPESGESDNIFVRTAGASARATNQLPSLKNSIWAITRNEELIGNCLALNARSFLMPRHVAKVAFKDTCIFAKEKERRIMPPHLDGEFNYSIVPVGADLCIVQMMSSKVPEFPGCRSQITKFKKAIAASGRASFFCRDAKGQLVSSEGNYITPTQSVSYQLGGVTYIIGAKDVRMVDSFSQEGYCGGIYVDVYDGASEVCFGVHVARGGIGESKAVLEVVAQDTLTVKLLPTSGNVPIQGVAESGDLLYDSGITCVGKSNYPATRRHDTKKEKSIFYKSLGCTYELAHLRTVEVGDDVRIDPLRKALRKLGDRVNEPIVGKPGLPHVVVALVKEYKKIFVKEDLLDYPQVVTSESGLASVKKKKAAGDMYQSFGGLKEVAFIPGTNELRPDYLEFLNTFEDWLCPEDWATRDGCDFPVAESVGNGALKDEPRQKEKVNEVSTRLFISVCMHEFFVQRRYFGDIVKCWSSCTTGVSSALGVSPRDFDILHEHLSSAGAGAGILALDHKHMDGHVRPRMIRFVSMFVVHLTESFSPDGRYVDPLFGKVDQRGFMMCRLLYRIAWFILKIGDAVAELGAMHPSGSFLTAFINQIVQDILTIWCIHKLLDISVEKAIQRFPRVFLGDDSLLAIPKKYRSRFNVDQYIKLMADQGFEVVPSDDKGGTIKMFDLWDGVGESEYQFLSRKFYSSDSGVVGVLDPAKVTRIISFNDKGKCLANMPQQMLSFFDEVRLGEGSQWHRDYELTWKNALSVISDNFFDKGKSMTAEQIQFEVLSYCTKILIPCTAEGGDETPAVEAPDATTTFVSNAPGSSLDPHPVHKGEFWRMSGMESYSHGDPDVFNRPVAITDGVWDAASPDELAVIQMPSDFFRNNPNAQAKLANYTYLKATAVLRVVITSSPYTAGKALLGVVPQNGDWQMDKYRLSGCPCVEIDASSGKEVELRVPCVMPHGFAIIPEIHLSTYAPKFNWAIFHLMVVSPIGDVSDSPVHYRVYGWLEDTLLFGPTHFPISFMPEAKEGSSQLIDSDREVKVNPFAVSMGSSQVSESNRLSAAIDKYVTPTIKSVGGAAVEIGTIVLAGAKIAMLMGLSVPTMSNNTTYTQDVNNADSMHVSGLCPSLMLANSSQQKVVLPVNSFSIHGDEMDIARYCSRPGLAGNFRFAKTDIVGSTIAQIAVNPGLCVIDIATAPPTYLWTPLAFASSFFQLWRGSIVYRFAAAKTKFHAGIIEIVWKIGSSTTAPVTDQEAANCYRVVWNLAESSSFQFTVPYISCLQWGMCRRLSIGSAYNFNTEQTGNLFVRVVTPLISAGELVTDSINILVYTSGGSDIEFAVPMHPVVVGDPAPEPVFKAEGRSGGVYQSDITQGVEEVETKMMAPANPLSPMGRITTIGEEIFNFRSLTRRFCDEGEMVTIGPTGKTFLTRELWSSHRAVRRLQRSFSFYTGSWRLEFVSLTFGDTGHPYKRNGVFRARTIIQGMQTAGAPETYQQVSIGKSLIFSVPYHELTPYLPSEMLSNDTTTAVPNIQFVAYCPLGDEDFLVRTAAGDDFTFGWQIGPQAEQFMDATNTVAIQYCYIPMA